jgi:hypothetical protein
VERRRDGVEIVLRLRGDHPELATVEKRVTVAGATVSARYRLTAPAEASSPDDGRCSGISR